MGHSTRRGRKVQKMTNKEFIETIGRAAVAEYERFKILPSLTIAQAILESNWGKSLLSQKAFNFFGMKAGTGWKGATYNSKTQEQTKAGQAFTVNAAFRAYPNVQAGIRGYYVFLQFPRYQNLKGVTDYKQACRLIKADGWATDVRYTEKLISLIEKYGLDKYDEEVLEVVEKCKIIINGKEHTVERILNPSIVSPRGNIIDMDRAIRPSPPFQEDAVPIMVLEIPAIIRDIFWLPIDTGRVVQGTMGHVQSSQGKF